MDAGVREETLIVDPGIGFGKSVDHNLEIFRRINELRSLGRPIMVGSSRKSFLGRLTGQPVDQRMLATATTVAACALSGVDLVRVHDVADMKEVATIASALRRGKA